LKYVNLVILIKFCQVYLTFQAPFTIVFDLTLKQKYVKQYKQFKYNPKMCTKYQINLTKFD